MSSAKRFFRPRLEELESRDVPSTYNVGPGEQFTTIGAVPWNNLQPGDTVNIYWQATPYYEKILAFSQRYGFAAHPDQRHCGAQGQLADH